MRTSFLPVPLLLALACSDAPDSRDGSSSDAAGTGKLTFEELTHDFGAVDDTRRLAFGYAFTNTGSAPVEIVAVEADCGCMVTELDERTFAPGDSGVIRMGWQPEGSGRQTKTIDVVTSDGQPARFRLRASADVTPVVRVSPADAGFGDVPVGEGASLRLFAASSDPEMTLLGVDSSHPSVTASHTPGAAVGLPLEAWVIDVEVAPDVPKGRLLTTLTLRIRAYSEHYSEVVRYSLEHHLTGTVVGKLKPEPFAFLIGTVPPGGRIRGEVLLERPDGEAFKILTSSLVRLESPEVELSVEPIPGRAGSAYRLEIDGPVGDYVGSLTGAVVIVTTDVPEDARVTLPLLGRVGAPGK